MTRLPRANSPVSLSSEVWNQLADVLERLDRVEYAPPLWVEDDGRVRTVGVAPPAPGGFWAQLTDSATLSLAAGPTWKYAWSEQRRTATGWEAAPDARSGTTTVGYALNTVATADAAPVGGAGGAPAIGAIVRLYADALPDSDNTAYTFSWSPPALFPVNLTQTGGIDGTATLVAGYTYTATTLAGVTLGTNLSPEWPRGMGSMTPATKGTGYFNASGTFVLHQVSETLNVNGCP